MLLRALSQTAVRTPSGYGLPLVHHQPTLRLMLDIGGAQLIETILRISFREHDGWQPSDPSSNIRPKAAAGELAASLCMCMDPAANPAAAMSVLATVRKVLAVQADSIDPAAANQEQAVAECCLTCVEALIAACNDPHREALFAYTAAWVLPALLTREPNEERLRHWLGSLARLVAYLYPTAAITDAVAQHMFSRIAAVFQSRLHSAIPDEPSISAALCMMCMAINLISAHPGGYQRLRCQAVVQTGLLGHISRMACRWWADEGRLFAYGLLIKRLLPAMCAILPADAATSSRLAAADACFADADIDTDLLPGPAPVKNQPATDLGHMLHNIKHTREGSASGVRTVTGSQAGRATAGQ
ncbi:hypothetical protein WJX72_001858 [[Myrmecia] bisecta]|uniref:Uncharacterized protein n=1 Tax=[Myrmecia] bisecta TaxID=41462 RepID=A0AAW1QPD7_9CHLO